MTYPACAKRLEGEGRHPSCNDPSKSCFQRLVRPADCRRCLNLPEPEASEEPPAEPPPAPAPPTDVPTPPGLVRRAYSYAEAVARWMAAGQPVRPDKEVERLFNENCKTCKWFDPEKQICRGCGCRVAESGVAVRNKIKMATEHCPRELW